MVHSGARIGDAGATLAGRDSFDNERDPRALAARADRADRSNTTLSLGCDRVCDFAAARGREPRASASDCPAAPSRFSIAVPGSHHARARPAHPRRLDAGMHVHLQHAAERGDAARVRLRSIRIARPGSVPMPRRSTIRVCAPAANDSRPSRFLPTAMRMPCAAYLAGGSCAVADGGLAARRRPRASERACPLARAACGARTSTDRSTHAVRAFHCGTAAAPNRRSLIGTRSLDLRF